MAVDLWLLICELNYVASATSFIISDQNEILKPAFMRLLRQVGNLSPNRPGGAVFGNRS
jgi:hypothetical protein